MDRIEFKQICPRCGKEFSVFITQNELNKGCFRKFCSRSCANARIHSESTKAKIAKSVTGYYNTHEFPKGFNVGYKTYTCKCCGKEFTMKDKRDTTGRKYCSTKCKDEWLRINLYSKSGGLREHSGTGKSGWYKGIYCSSTWELAFVVYYLDHNLHIKRCNEKRKYEYEGIEHTYYPDFITDNGIIEIKGYENKQWEAKRKYNPDIIVLYKNDMLPYINYVKNKYTNVLTDLYDNSKPEPILNRKYYWMHKGTENTMVPICKFNDYIKNGWIKGRYIKH